MNPSLKVFDHAFVEFKTSWIKGSRTIWICEEYGESSHHSWTKESVKEKFAYGVPNSTCFPQTIFDLNRATSLLADRYGGHGLGVNGGSGRIGIVDDFQIKGIGQTPLVGNRDGIWHAYGGQSLINAVLETINAEVFGHILPIGAVKCVAIIYTGPDTAYMPSGSWEDSRGPGALLVRELCVRPAHFLRAPNFKIPPEFEATLLDDVQRVRSVNLQLSKVAGDHHKVIQFIGAFLSNCADQFVFARIFGIHHGVLSPSNISFDGQWLDLGNVGFVGSGTNYVDHQSSVPFYDEMYAALQYVEEFMDTYAKYNRVDLDITPLTKYYQQEVDRCFIYYAVCVFGLAPKNIEDIRPEDPYITVVNKLKDVLSLHPVPVIAIPTGTDLGGPVTALVEHLFRSLCDKPISTDDLCRSFLQTINAAFRVCAHDCSFRSFVISSAIRSFKKLYFTPFFTRARLVPRLVSLVREHEPEFFSAYINDHVAVAKWLFQDDSCSTAILFMSRTSSLSYAITEARYIIETEGMPTEHICSVSSLLAWVENQNNDFFFIDNYDFKFGLLRLLPILEALEAIGDEG